MQTIQFCFRLVLFKGKITNLDFSEKKLLLLLTFLQWKKPLFKIIFWHKIFICQQIFKIFVALLKTFGMQNGDMVIFFLMSFRKVRF